MKSGLWLEIEIFTFFIVTKASQISGAVSLWY